MQMKLLAIMMIINRHEISLTLLSSTPWFSDHIDQANSYAFPWWNGAHGAPKGTATTQPGMSPLGHARESEWEHEARAMLLFLSSLWIFNLSYSPGLSMDHIFCSAPPLSPLSSDPGKPRFSLPPWGLPVSGKVMQRKGL